MPMIIDGAATGASFERKDPVTGETATVAPAATRADVDAACDAAQQAAAEWAATTPEHRRTVLLAAADALEARGDEFTELMLTETGATAPWAGFNVGLGAGNLREAAAMTTQITGDVIPANKPNILALAVRRPIGVCAAMAPWNAPVILGTRAIAMPLACGNAVVFKASEMSPGTHRLIVETMWSAGVPKGALQYISNAPSDAAEVVEALVSHPAIGHVNFTGSTRVGRIIGELAGRHLKPVLLELGGKAPLIVLDDADLDGAVNAAIFGSFLHQGQICMSTERIIVHEAIADDFVERLAARAAQLPAGDPRGHVVLGSLASEESAARMEDLIADATAQGASVVAGGVRKGTIVEATLIDGVDDGMRIYGEESFGPVKPIVRVADDDEAVRIANDTEYGLSASVFSSNVTRAMTLADRIESGICHINGPTVADEAQMPFGGVKASGFGRFGGRAAVDEFTIQRWITIEDPGQHYPF